MSIRIQSQSEEPAADLSAWKIVGPVSVLCTLAIAFQSMGNADLFAVAVAGMFFCAYWRLRGLIYSLALLVLVALFKHLLFIDDHLWRAGLESSIAIGFATTALAFEWNHSVVEGWRTTAQNREQTIRHLEEEMAKIKSEDQQQLIALQDRIAQLQKESEESLSEAASLQILNEVVRKQAAQASLEREEMAQGIIEKDRRIAAVLSELETAQHELSFLQDEQRLKNELDQLKQALSDSRVEHEQVRLSRDTFEQLFSVQAQKIEALETEVGQLGRINGEHQAHKESLWQSLEEARAQKEQTEEINETLQQMVSTHGQKAGALEQQLGQLQQQLVERNSLTADLARWNQVADKLAIEKNFLQERLSHTENDLSLMAKKWQHAEERLLQAEQLREQFVDSQRTASASDQWQQKAEEIATRANFLEKRLSEAETELSFTSEKLEQAEEELQQAQAAASGQVDGKDGLIRHLEERVQNLTHTQSLYFQLKKQFEEKNQVLSDTRTELFRVQTSLDALKIEKEQAPIKPVEEELLTGFERQFAILQEENSELTQLISVLTDPANDLKKSKKKMKQTPPEQDLLF